MENLKFSRISFVEKDKSEFSRISFMKNSEKIEEIS